MSTNQLLAECQAWRERSERAEKELEMRKMFSEYLEGALVAFEQPHNLKDAERLEIYYQAFASVVGPHLGDKHDS